MLTGAAIALAGVLVGRLLPNRRRGPKPVKAVCGCTHGIGFHADKTGACTGLMDKWSSSSGTKQIPCTCQHYDGPVPVESMFSTPLLPPTDAP